MPIRRKGSATECSFSSASRNDLIRRRTHRGSGTPLASARISSADSTRSYRGTSSRVPWKSMANFYLPIVCTPARGAPNPTRKARSLPPPAPPGKTGPTLYIGVTRRPLPLEPSTKVYLWIFVARSSSPHEIERAKLVVAVSNTLLNWGRGRRCIAARAGHRSWFP